MKNEFIPFFFFFLFRFTVKICNWKLFPVPKYSIFPGRYCGSSLPAKVYAQGTSLYIKLASDESDTGKGFQVSWTSKHLGGNTGLFYYYM